MDTLPTNGGVDWDHTHDYVSLTARTVPPNGLTAYTRPHPAGQTATDVTSFVYGQAKVHLNNWPEIMYSLYPTQEWKDFQHSGKPGQKTDLNGQPMFEKWPREGQTARPLLAFDVLPDNISSNEDWWWFDLWRRVDPRVHWDDITMRIEQPAGEVRTRHTDLKFVNATQNTTRRLWHAKYFMLSWFGTGRWDNQNKAKTAVLAALSEAGIDAATNSTRGLTPGLVDPANGPNSRRIPHPQLGVNVGRRRKARSSVAPVIHILGRKRKRHDSDDEDEDDENEAPDASEIEETRVIYQEAGENELSEIDAGSRRPRGVEVIDLESDDGVEVVDLEDESLGSDSDGGDDGEVLDLEDESDDDGNREVEVLDLEGESLESYDGGEETHRDLGIDEGGEEISESEDENDEGFSDSDIEGGSGLEAMAPVPLTIGGAYHSGIHEDTDSEVDLTFGNDASSFGRQTGERLSVAGQRVLSAIDNNVVRQVPSSKSRNVLPDSQFSIAFNPVNIPTQDAAPSNIAAPIADPINQQPQHPYGLDGARSVRHIELPFVITPTPSREVTPTPTETPGLRDHSAAFVSSGALAHLPHPTSEMDDSDVDPLEALLDDEERILLNDY